VPFSSLGWPDDTPDLRAFYPGSTLVTAPEILFFWVARMVMAGLEFMGDVPFATVYLHGTVRDTQHRKMSKSLGNGIDPLEVVERYGADALRFTMISGMAVGTDLILDPNDLESSFAAGRNFANKLWNAARFILTNVDGPIRPLAGPAPNTVQPHELSLPDRWIIARCQDTVLAATDAYERYRLNDAANAVYRFLWSDLADWYLEQIKPRLYGDEPGGDVARAIVVKTFEVALRLLHPVMPFITEALWQALPGHAGGSIMQAPWPLPDPRAADSEAERAFSLIQELVGAIRAIRAEYHVEPGRPVPIRIAWRHPAFESERETIQRLAKVSAIRFGEPPAEPGAHDVLSDGNGLFVPLGDAIDVGRECARLTGEIDRLAKLLDGQRRKLANEQFIARAPALVVDNERRKLSAWEEQSTVLTQKRRLLGCG